MDLDLVDKPFVSMLCSTFVLTTVPEKRGMRELQVRVWCRSAKGFSTPQALGKALATRICYPGCIVPASTCNSALVDLSI